MRKDEITMPELGRVRREWEAQARRRRKKKRRVKTLIYRCRLSWTRQNALLALFSAGATARAAARAVGVNGANVTLNSFGKWQTQGQSYIYVDATSSLTISAADNFGYRGDAASFDIASYEGLKLTRSVWSNANPSPAFNINLHEQGSVKAAWSLSGDISIVFTADLAYSTTNAGQYTITETSDDGQYRLVQRTLWVNEHDNGGLIDSDGHVFTLNGDELKKSTDALTASADSLGKYCLEKIDTVGGGKNIVVSYVEAIPEPSAFGLLAGLGALALVASRRRRK